MAEYAATSNHLLDKPKDEVEIIDIIMVVQLDYSALHTHSESFLQYVVASQTWVNVQNTSLHSVSSIRKVISGELDPVEICLP